MEAESLSMSFNSQSKKGMSMFRRKARSKNDKLSSMLSKGSKKSKSKKYMSASRSVLMPSAKDYKESVIKSLVYSIEVFSFAIHSLVSFIHALTSLLIDSR